jgi:hypothetical protein
MPALAGRLQGAQMSTVRTRLGVLATSGVLAAAGLATGATAAVAQSLPACGNSALDVTRTYVDSGMGHSWMLLVYRNRTAHSCTVTGYPGLDAIGPKGHVLANARRTLNGGHVRTITIQPGGYASAGVEWENFNGATGGSCGFSTAVNTIVANTSRVHRLRVSVSRCGLQVHTTVAGTPLYPNYGPAQHEWIKGATVDAADMGRYFDAAAKQLKKSGDYPTQVKELLQLASLPDTGLTAKQQKEARTDVKDLDQFFATPGLYN